MKKLLNRVVATAITITILSMTVLLSFSVMAEDLLDGMQNVTATGTLTITISSSVSNNYTATAYEVLQMVIPKDNVQPSSMTNEINSTNVYRVTDEFDNFFKTTKSDYDTIKDATTLYLTYNSENNCLNIVSGKPNDTESED